MASWSERRAARKAEREVIRAEEKAAAEQEAEARRQHQATIDAVYRAIGATLYMVWPCSALRNCPNCKCVQILASVKGHRSEGKPPTMEWRHLTRVLLVGGHHRIDLDAGCYMPATVRSPVTPEAEALLKEANKA